MSGEYFLRLYDYGTWANRRVIELLRQQSQDNERARKWLCHVLNAERVWITRLGGEDSAALPIWSQLSLDECAELLEQNNTAYQQFLSNLTNDGLQQIITYKNSKGVEFHTPVVEILTHVAFHGAYHRGHIATVVRDAGGEPINTDFITFVREQS